MCISDTLVIINLAGNAIKFTERGNVTISCNAVNFENGTVQVEFKVTDTGIGIAPEKLEHVFESFSQATADTTRKYGGTGLGLSISKNLVELMGGKISVQSKLNEGTTFSFSVNYKNSTEEESAKQIIVPIKEMASRLSGIKVLLAEDNAFNRMVAVDTLQELIKDVKITEAENGKEAIEKLQQDSYDIILMDIQMPVMDGYEAMKQIRKQKNENGKPEIPIIALSAGVTKAEVDKCFEAGANDYVAKPFEPSELISKMANLFSGA